MQSESLYQGSISVCFNQEGQELFDIFVNSIYPEVVNPVETTRIQLSTSIDFHNLCINVEISVYSLSQLRALVNSVMYLTYVILSTLNIVKTYTQGIK